MLLVIFLTLRNKNIFLNFYLFFFGYEDYLNLSVFDQFLNFGRIDVLEYFEVVLDDLDGAAFIKILDDPESFLAGRMRDLSNET